MQDSSHFFPADLYSHQLSVIRDISFTRREVDVMACLLNGRGTSKIADLLSISPRTIQTHIRNITLKIERNTQEAIIDFLEPAEEKIKFLRVHYNYLQVEATFRKSLKSISKITHEKKTICILGSKEQEECFQYSLLVLLREHLILAGFQITHEPTVHEDAYIIYALPSDTKVIEPSFLQYPKDKALFLLPPDQEMQSLPKELKSFKILSAARHQNYYFYVFDILETLVANVKIDSIILSFQEKYKRGHPLQADHPLHSSPQITKKAPFFPEYTKSTLSSQKWLVSAFLCVAFLISIGIISLYWTGHDARQQPVALSELPLPIKAVFLERPELLRKIDHSFTKEGDIQTIALVGIGGSGKTTLARQYAHEQRANVVWEINAETKNNLTKSFEYLAHSLAKKSEDKKALRGILDIKDSSEKEVNVLSFVKEHLRESKNWFLIFDNVEKFADIQNHFPQGSKVWGEGRVILTTRDSNFENNKLINSVIFIGELNQDQKVNLFTKIMYHKKIPSLSPTHRQEVRDFLEQIPPFPLDVSVAAYYVKTTKILFKKYLQNLESYSRDFMSVQENLLKEAGTKYLETRYGIITLSLEKLIETHKDFEHLLLLISLIDSQNIPRKLLDSCKKDAVVDNFIHNLRKYSLITNNAYDSFSSLAFSIHRSTQTIILTYLRKKLHLDKNKEIVQSIGAVLERYMNDLYENDIYAYAMPDETNLRELISHSKIFLTHDDLLTDSIRAAITVGAVSIYVYPKNSKERLEKALQILNKNPDENYHRIGKVFSFLGILSWNTGDYEKAQFFNEKSLMIYKQHLANNHLGFARALVFSSHTLRQLGHYKQAKNAIEKALTIYHQHYSNGHPRIAWSLSFLGTVKYELGHYERAKKILEQSLSIIEKNYPSNLASIHRTVTFLGLVHWKLNNYEKAKYYIEKSIDIGKKDFPELHYALEWSMVVLGNLLRDMGEYEKARTLFEKGLVFREKHYGKDHFETAKVLRDLGQLYLLEGNIEKADSFLKRSLTIFQQSNHVELFTILENLADLYQRKSILLAQQKGSQQSKYFKDQAVDYLKQALKIIETRISADSPHKGPIELKLKNLQG